MSTNQTTTVDMSDEQLQTEIHGVQLIADTDADPDSDNHAACVDGCWFTLDEVEEIYTEVIEQETPRRDSYVLDDLSSIDFYHNYDGTYTLDDYEATTLEPVEWEAICEWFMQQFSANEPEYVNDLLEYLQTDDSVVDWHRYGDHLAIGLEISDTTILMEARHFDISVKNIEKDNTFGGDVYVSVEGPSVDEIAEAEDE